MFNSNKQEELKDKAANLADTVKDGAHDVANDVRRTADRIGDTVNQKSYEVRNEATSVIDSLKSLVNQYTSTSNITDLKNQILDKAYELKGTVKDEVAHAYAAGKERTEIAVQDKPLVSLGLAIGAGLLLGYILGSKQSSNKY